MQKKHKAFTLIELLIVITIISIIAGFIVVASQSVRDKALIESTRATIMALMTGCDEYRAIFKVYPDINNSTTLQNNGYQAIGGDTTALDSFDEDDFAEFNRRLRFVLMDIKVSNDEEIDGDVLVSQKLPTVTADGVPAENPGDNEELVADAFGNFLRVCPGRDHTNDNPQGPNNFNADNRSFTMVDIYSLGANGQDDTDGFSDDDSTEFALIDSDEIVSWNIERTKKRRSD